MVYERLEAAGMLPENQIPTRKLAIDDATNILCAAGIIDPGPKAETRKLDVKSRPEKGISTQELLVAQERANYLRRRYKESLSQDVSSWSVWTYERLQYLHEQERIMEEIELNEAERISVIDLGFTNRVCNALLRSNWTLTQLPQLSTAGAISMRTSSEILEIRTVGNLALEEIESKLAEHGLALATEDQADLPEITP